MDKIRSAANYIDTVRANSNFFKQYYYHAILDLNLIKLDSILKYGLLSKRLIQEKGLTSLYTHDSSAYDSKNGDTYVSLTQYTNSCEFDDWIESFPLHTLNNLALLINKSIDIELCGERNPDFCDEIFCFDVVQSDKLEGIMVPEHLSSLPINQINCLVNDISCFTKRYINHWIQCTQNYFGQPFTDEDIQSIRISYEELWNILNKWEFPEKSLQLSIEEQRQQYGKDLKDVLAGILHRLWEERYKISNPTFMDIVMRINDGKLPVYEIQRKRLRRVI